MKPFEWSGEDASAENVTVGTGVRIHDYLTGRSIVLSPEDADDFCAKYVEWRIAEEEKERTAKLLGAWGETPHAR